MERFISPVSYEADPLAADASDGRTVRGIAVPYNVPDGRPGVEIRIDPETDDLDFQEFDATVFVPGVFSRSLSDAKSRERVSYLWSHGLDKPLFAGTPTALPIGRITDLIDGPDALRFEARLAQTDMGTAIAQLLAEGAIRENSITTRPRQTVIEDGTRYMKEAELWDISHVVWGQFGPLAAVTEVRAANLDLPPELRSLIHSLANVPNTRESFVGATFSAANIEAIMSAVSAMREQLDALDELIKSSTKRNGSESDLMSAWLRLQELECRELSI